MAFELFLGLATLNLVAALCLFCWIADVNTWQRVYHLYSFIRSYTTKLVYNRFFDETILSHTILLETGWCLMISITVIIETGFQAVLQHTYAHLDYNVHDSLHVQYYLHVNQLNLIPYLMHTHFHTTISPSGTQYWWYALKVPWCYAWAYI